MPFPYNLSRRKKRHCRVLYIIPAQPELISLVSSHGELEIGNWKLGIGNWKLEIGN